MRVLLYERVDDREPADVIEFDPRTDRWGDIWSMFVPGLRPASSITSRPTARSTPSQGQRFDPQARLIDPYAKALAGKFLPADDGIIRPPKCVVVDDDFDWQGDRHLRRHAVRDDHLRDARPRLHRSASPAASKHPGTYLGVIEKIPYLKSLGVTAVELMPVHEFPTERCLRQQAASAPNYWGYDPLAFFAPHRGYCRGDEPGARCGEFKEMVRALHAGGHRSDSRRGLQPHGRRQRAGPDARASRAWRTASTTCSNGGGTYKNYSGCGNTVNGNHPIVREMIFHCLRHWVHNYHIDGFRFDLASILSRNRNGELVPNPPLVELIAEDPLLADTKIIAEAWDAAGAYQVGSFANLRWAEWNGHYRDDIRRFWRGDCGHDRPDGHAAGRLQRPVPAERPPAVSQHQLHHVARRLHAQRPGELRARSTTRPTAKDNRDGDNNNYSDNYGVEGPTRRQDIDDLRQRQIKNMLASLLLSQGVPMIAGGRRSAAARSAATTTPTARTTPSAGSTGGWSRRTPRCSGSCRR